MPLVLLAAMVAYLFFTGGGLRELAGPPIEELTIGRVLIPEPGRIEVTVVNDGPEPVTIAQVLVDEAYWHFTARPSTTLDRFDRATLRIPYARIEGEAHFITLITSLGTTFEKEIAGAVQSPKPSVILFGRFTLVGLYVGVVPVLLGVLWYPLMRKVGRRGLTFLLALTLGLLAFLAVATWLDAIEFADELPAFWQGMPMVVFVALGTFGILLSIGGNRGNEGRSPLAIAHLIALGIGIHNLGEGLAIGAAYALGEAALGRFLVLGFTLHNITEGVGIAAPVVKKNPGIGNFVLLVVLAGFPAVIGTWIGGFSFNPVLATVLLAVGLGAILHVICRISRSGARVGRAGPVSVIQSARRVIEAVESLGPYHAEIGEGAFIKEMGSVRKAHEGN